MGFLRKKLSFRPEGQGRAFSCWRLEAIKLRAYIFNSVSLCINARQFIHAGTPRINVDYIDPQITQITQIKLF
jgi:hypothetical protein